VTNIYIQPLKKSGNINIIFNSKLMSRRFKKIKEEIPNDKAKVKEEPESD
jgi:hypothetical protein